MIHTEESYNNHNAPFQRQRVRMYIYRVSGLWSDLFGRYRIRYRCASLVMAVAWRYHPSLECVGGGGSCLQLYARLKRTFLLNSLGEGFSPLNSPFYFRNFLATVKIPDRRRAATNNHQCGEEPQCIVAKARTGTKDDKNSS